MALDNNELSGHVDPSLGSLAKLEKLSLHENDLKGYIPSEICALRTVALFRLTVDCDDVYCTCCDRCWRDWHSWRSNIDAGLSIDVKFSSFRLSGYERERESCWERNFCTDSPNTILQAVLEYRRRDNCTASPNVVGADLYKCCYTVDRCGDNHWKQTFPIDTVKYYGLDFEHENGPRGVTLVGMAVRSTYPLTTVGLELTTSSQREHRSCLLEVRLHGCILASKCNQWHLPLAMIIEGNAIADTLPLPHCLLQHHSLCWTTSSNTHSIRCIVAFGNGAS